MGFCKKIKEDFSKAKCKTWIVPEGYSTPASDYPLDKYHGAKLTRKPYSKEFIGIMEGVDGYDFFCSDKPIPVTSLKINNQTWMVDDPLHWEGMQRLAEKSEGSVLLGGLGLGLLPHALKKNKKVKQIDIYERDEDVIKLMKNKIPKDVRIHNKDISEYPMKRIQKIFSKEKPMSCHDTVILDIWVGQGTPNKWAEMMGFFNQFKQACPNSKIMIWGTGISDINPAIPDDYEPCKIQTEIKKQRLSK